MIYGLYCKEGKGVFYPTPDTEVTFTKGQVIVSKKGECHGAKNTGTEDVVFVSIVAPVPADYDVLVVIQPIREVLDINMGKYAAGTHSY